MSLEASKQIKKEIFDWAIVIIVAIVLSMVVMFFLRPTLVYGSSMEPTFTDKEYLLMSKASVFFKGIARGDIIVFRTHLKTEGGGDKNLIKRVIGVPGDVIEIEYGVVKRNGEVLKEPYVLEAQASALDNLRVTVPEGHYFAMGDNRLYSKDSRDEDVGLVIHNKVLGKVLFRILPMNKAGFVN